MQSPTLIDRARGCLLGLAIGDALGAPLAGLKAGRVTQLFGAVDGFVDAREAWEDKPHRWHLPGLHTDETQQALSLAAVLSAKADFDPRAVANLWQRMAFEPRDDRLRLGAHRGWGSGFAQSVRAMREREEITGRPSAGSGAAARIAPLGLALHATPERLTDAVIGLSILTHTDPRAIAGALAVAHAVALAVESHPMDTEALFTSLVERVHDGERRMMIDHLGALHLPDNEEGVDPLHAMSQALRAIGGLVREGDDDLAIRTLLRQANRLAPKQPITSPTSGFAPATVAIAIHLAFAHDRFATPVTRMAAEGKDSDTAAAIVGALMGARLGEECIPADWRNQLIAASQIRAFADAVIGGPSAPAPPDLVEMELDLTLRELAARAPLEAAAAKRQAREKRREESRPKKPQPKPKPTEHAIPGGLPPHVRRAMEEDPLAKQRDRAARGRKRIEWKDGRRRDRKREE